MAKRQIEIVIDSREKVPLLFPATLRVNDVGRVLATSRSTLQTGDYSLAGSPTGCVVERKGSISEIASNLLSPDKARQLRAFDRLASCACPILVVEQAPSDFLRPSKYVPDPAAALDALLSALLPRRIAFWPVGNCAAPTRRRLLGELLAHVMVCWEEKLPLPPCTLTP